MVLPRLLVPVSNFFFFIILTTLTMEARSTERKGITVEEVEDEEEEEEEDESGGGGLEEDDKKKGAGVSGRRGSSGGGRVVSPPFCQAERCGADLTVAKRYHRRHKVCELHSKAPVVVVAGLRQRFCQQCSRFHELAEFDEAKRSCRRRLARHNERRRKSSTAGTCWNEGSSSGIKGQQQQHTSESHCRNNADDDWRKVQMNMARSSGDKFYHFR